MDAEGVAPAKKYYQKHGVTFPALVDADYATGFGYVPWKFFVDEHGVVRSKGGDWQKLIKPFDQLKPVTPDILAKWSDPEVRLGARALGKVERRQREQPRNLAITTDLASRYLALNRKAEARELLRAATANHDAKKVARSGSPGKQQALSRAYLQLSRTLAERPARVKAARTAYFLNPTIGLAKQISRIADPARFDNREDGRLDNPYRNNYASQIKKDRATWLQADGSE